MTHEHYDAAYTFADLCAMSGIAALIGYLAGRLAAAAAADKYARKHRQHRHHPANRNNTKERNPQ